LWFEGRQVSLEQKEALAFIAIASDARLLTFNDETPLLS
jgi:hypothetical protein